MNFREFLETTTAGDVAGVDSRLGTVKRPMNTKELTKCEKHDLVNCTKCKNTQNNITS